MILDQTIGSARAEGHLNHVGRRLMGSLLTAVLALILVLASLTNLAAVEALSQTAETASHTLPLPRIQYLESMPWMDWNASAPTLRIDTLMLPGGPPWGDPQDLQVVTKGSTTLS
ncbi:MAG TPA: hypothetical protein VFL62_11325 [Bradyrhizobium sp.]|uniref:hypothetical protein n=1 Tax=Bradyrhizobium sp. TaxID=376 RepID=UPI002D803D50|nr:hypothetical protein [Bradyrhizobium sp.]HET7886808.1 hypothetical protein [Bradyrhizobium sp.]